MEWTLEQVSEMRNGRPVYRDSQQGGALCWVRTAKETGGEYSLLYGEVGAGRSVPPHYHTIYTESFKVLEGELQVRTGARTVSLKVGVEAAVLPRIVHGWSTRKEGPTIVISEFRPAHEGFEKWIMMLHNMAADGLTKPGLQPNSLVHAALFLADSDTHLAGSARVLSPFFKAVAWYAHKAGVDRKLEEKYYRPSLLSS